LDLWYFFKPFDQLLKRFWTYQQQNLQCLICVNDKKFVLWF